MARAKGFNSAFGPGFGVGRYRYVLAPWIWDTASIPHWRTPSLSVGCVDLRTLAEMGTPGPTQQGLGFFVQATNPSSGDVIASSFDLREEPATVLMRDTWEANTGFRPAGTNLVDLLWDQITTGSDPSGESGPKPLVPETDGELRLFLGGHSEVKRERFEFGRHPHTNRVRDLLRRDFSKMWEATDGDDHCRRVLDFHCEKYRVSDWREFVPQSLQRHVPGRLPHETTITDNFNRANVSPLSNSAEGWAWSQIESTWVIFSNRAQPDTGSTVARAESALSSTDHYAQVSLNTVAGDGRQRGVMCRQDGTATLSYYEFTADPVTSTWRTTKRVSGTRTDLPPNSTQAVASGDIIKGECNGSTIRRLFNGAQQTSLTDTSIASGLYTGISSQQSTNSHVDDFTAADLGGAAAVASKLILLGVG